MYLDAWLTFLQATYPGAPGALPLFRSRGSAADIVRLSRRDLLAAGLDAKSADRLRSPDGALLTAWQRWLERPGHALITLDSPAYPPLLQVLPDPPLALWSAGARPDLLRAPQLAMVGSRNPTHIGRDTAEAFARYLSDRGLTITSGLATGIDGACHRGGLAGAAGTVAVLGSGLDVIFPKTNLALARRIIDDGLLISEYPPLTPARPVHFPQRNRIIAGLSVGTLVVEAARRSGSLITARLAAEYGREVFAMPGSIHSPLARGCHRLIKDGAKLVEDATDVLVELASLLQIAVPDEPADEISQTDSSSLTEQAGYPQLLQALGFEPSSVGDISERTGLTTAELSSMLLLLELEGLVEAQPGGLYSRLPKRTA